MYALTMSRPYAEGSIQAAAQTANTIRNHQNDYRSAIRTNHDLTMHFAASLEDVRVDDASLQKELEEFMMEQKQRLMKVAGQNVLQDRQIDVFVTALDAVRQSLQNDPNQQQDYGALLESEMTKATQQQPPLNIHQQPMVRDLRLALGLQASADDPEEEEELQIIATSSTQTLKCPLSGAMLQDPVRSKVCKHVYSKVALQQYLAQKQGRNCACPVVGCTNRNLTFVSCEPDHTTAMQIKRRERKQAHEKELRMSQAANVDSDDEEAEFQ
jgi:hypothetical protein